MDVRRSALGVLSRLDHGAGIPPLIELARANLSGDRTWLSKESLGALARSGDPARTRFPARVSFSVTMSPTTCCTRRFVVSAPNTPPAATPTSFARSIHASPAIARATRCCRRSPRSVGRRTPAGCWASLATRTRRSPTRRRALSYASRAGVPTADLVKLYDTTTDPQMKDALIGFYAQSGDKPGRRQAAFDRQERRKSRASVAARLRSSRGPKIRG